MQNLQQLTVQFPVFIMAVIFHEFGHALMAKRFGDTTAQDSGRLTLNPLPHIDPIGTILFPAINMIAGTSFLIGWARPVPINPRAFTKIRQGLFWVAFAGPLMNFTLGFLSALILGAIVTYGSPESYLYEPFRAMAEGAIFMNFGLGMFNLIPLPPLDGGRMIESVLNYNMARQYEAIAQYSTWILIIGMFTGMLRFVMIPAQILANLSLVFAGFVFQ